MCSSLLLRFCGPARSDGHDGPACLCCWLMFYRGMKPEFWGRRDILASSGICWDIYKKVISGSALRSYWEAGRRKSWRVPPGVENSIL